MNGSGNPGPADASPRRRAISKAAIVGLVSGSVVVADQLTKTWIRRELPPHDVISVIPGFMSIIHASNPGGAFSLFAGMEDAIRLPFFFIAATFALGALLYFIYQIPAEQRWLLFAVSGVLGGAIGNLIDRAAFGHVTDFLLVYWNSWAWPAFNVADSFITVGVVILIAHSVFSRDEPATDG